VRQYASSASHADPGFVPVLCNLLSALWTADAAERNTRGANRGKEPDDIHGSALLKFSAPVTVTCPDV